MNNQLKKEDFPVTSLASSRILISVATYNESRNIVRLIKDISKYAPGADILVVDDNSPDGTGKIVAKMAMTDPRIEIIHRAGKLGLGTAMLRAFEFAIENNYKIILTMDADFSHNPKDIPALFAGMNDHDVMIGSRYVKGGGVKNWPWTRQIMSFGVNLMVRGLFRIKVRDASGAFRCYSTSVLAKARLDSMQSRGYSFLEELLHRCHLVGASIGETPIIFENRREGISKVSWIEAAKSLSILIRLGIVSLLGLSNKKMTQTKMNPIRVENRRAA